MNTLPNSEKTLSAAVDFSGMEATFSVASVKDSRKEIINERTILKGSDSLYLLKWMRDNLRQHNHQLTDIVEWTVGTGPGSFTGLRIVCSLILGLTYNKKQVKARGLPSAYAIAASISESQDTDIAVLYGGRRNDALLYLIKQSSDARSMSTPTPPRLVNSEAQLTKDLSSCKRIAALETDRKSLEALAPTIVEKIRFVDHVPVEQLLKLNPDEWDRTALTHPQYIRPAVHVAPKEKRMVV